MIKKFLCICVGGNVRSVAMAQIIKELNGKYREDNLNLNYEAIAIGKVYTSNETIKQLKEWADVVIDMEEYLPLDIWHNPRHPELLKEVAKIWQKYTEEHL